MSSHLAAQQDALFCNQGVAGSNPAGGTSIFKDLACLSYALHD